MKTPITNETISQQIFSGDNEGLNADVENNKEPITFEQKQNKLSKAREIYFKYFPSQQMARTKATVRQKAMMGMPLAHSVIPTKCISGKTGKGKTPRVSIK